MSPQMPVLLLSDRKGKGHYSVPKNNDLNTKTHISPCLFGSVSSALFKIWSPVLCSTLLSKQEYTAMKSKT